jgi:hypothetical protein
LLGAAAEFFDQRIAAARSSMWRRHWKASKRFDKPELDAAHAQVLQPIKPQP